MFIGRESDRKLAPVFVMGCHRSGTNLICDMLLSAGGFTIHRGYLPLYKKLMPRFGSMERAQTAKKSLRLGCAAKVTVTMDSIPRRWRRVF